MNGLTSAAVLVAISTVLCFGGNLGYVTGAQIMTGINGKKYIEVFHSGFELPNIQYWGTQIWAPVYIAWVDNDDVTNAINWANVLKSLSDHQIAIEVTSGIAVSNGIVSGTTVQVNSYKVVKP